MRHLDVGQIGYISSVVAFRQGTAFEGLLSEKRIPELPPVVQGVSHYPVRWFAFSVTVWKERYRCMVAYTATFSLRRVGRTHRMVNDGWMWVLLGHTICLGRGVYRVKMTYGGSVLGELRELPMAIAFTAAGAKQAIVENYEAALVRRVDKALEASP